MAAKYPERARRTARCTSNSSSSLQTTEVSSFFCSVQLHKVGSHLALLFKTGELWHRGGDVRCRCFVDILECHSNVERILVQQRRLVGFWIPDAFVGNVNRNATTTILHGNLLRQGHRFLLKIIGSLVIHFFPDIIQHTVIS
ncbi:hypothetical protein RvY_19183-2 [Ramazzottius varieornatus]|uniref:Uncharacterized protein n=1 Tax=Ramazzottius varieornatus TaxID=947166 RepID=A0A1D1W8J2_RAMVA|nr:hypothetical protein RvY_19183-2 [Ramazzottius varieornatus]